MQSEQNLRARCFAALAVTTFVPIATFSFSTYAQTVAVDPLSKVERQSAAEPQSMVERPFKVEAQTNREIAPLESKLAVSDIVVSGHYHNAVGSSDAASEGSITSQLLKTRPALRPGEVLEFVPGVIVTQHSGDGKANQYFLRGFNLDHGTDFATSIAGMPINLPTHAHGHGYTDLNFLMPELIDRIDYRKGPYFSHEGDFSSAGSAAISLRNRLDAPFGKVTFGANGYQRLLTAASPTLGNGANLLAALELQGNDGPWENPQRLRKQNAVLRYSDGSRADGFDVTLMSYQSRWNATDQIPLRAVESGQLGRFGSLDKSDGGQTTRHSLSTEWRKPLANGSALQASAYAISYSLDLFSNFSYFLDNPNTGDQFLQRDSRSVYGGSLKHLWAGKWAGRDVHTEFGLQMRHDRIKVGLFDSVAREVTATTRDDRVRQTSVGVFGESGISWTPWLRTIAGVRADQYRWDVRSNLDENSGRSSDTLVSPKFSTVFGPWAKTEYFLNWGRGFHSNDGRGTLTRIDPKSGQPTDPVKGLVRTTGYEFGIRSQLVPDLQSSLAIWRLGIGSELLFVGDAGTTEPSRASRRQGIEWNNRYTPKPWLLFDLDLALSHARFVEGDPSADRIPGSVSRVASASVAVRDLGPWSGSAQIRYLGPRPLIDDNSQQAKSSTLVNLRAGYRVNKQLELSVDVFNVFNRKVNDIDYYYSSRLRNEAAPVNDLHFHPAEPRAVRVSARLEF
jgi:outer membrane receptor protein involved in Fe transport